MAKLYWDSLYFLIIFCILTVFIFGTICIILVNLLEEGVLAVSKFFVRHYKLLKKAIFRTH